MSDSPTVLVTGAGGQVGHDLTIELAPVGKVVAMGRADLDVADPDAVREVVRRVRPALIVNAAAYTAVDRAESEPELCAAVNARAPAVLAEEARRLDAGIIHYSTDYVFDGTKGGPYVESDAPNPMSVYGRTKLEGEEGVAAAGAPYLILRTSWVYSARGHNFLLTILRLAHERTELRVVADQTGAPTWSRAIAAATAQILSRHGAEVRAWASRSGIYHVAAAGETTWYEFARAILDEVTDRGALACERIIPIPASEYPTAAARPLNSRLGTSKLRETFGVSLEDWRAALRSVMREIG